MNPQFDFRYFDQAVEDVWKLFRGQYPGYRACNTLYHDLRHTMLVLLAMARLIHGAFVQGVKFTDKEVNMGLISALMHDTGYIQTNDDNSGTGAKYTLIHIKRSIMFVQDYYADHDYFRDDLEKFSDILNCTGVSMDINHINFSSANVEIMGKILGTADLLGQMADRLYLEKLIPLFREFAEGKVPGFHSELDLLQKTTNFYHITRIRFEKDLGNVNRYMVNHFRERWNVERNLYDEAIEKNINYLKFILKQNEKNVTTCLRRNTITIQ